MRVLAKARKWGSSIGVVIPRHVVSGLHIKDKETIELEINKPARNDVLREIFGMARHVRKSGQEVKDELRRELWGKEY